jgi:hypothetical protein
MLWHAEPSPKRIARPRHQLIDAFVVPQPFDVLDDAGAVGADEKGTTGVDRFGPLRFMPKNQHGHAEGWRLFLQAAESVSTTHASASACCIFR